VRVVNRQEDVLFRADAGKLAKVRLFPLHREDAVGHHQAEARRRVLPEHLLEGRHVAVGHAEAFRLQSRTPSMIEAWFSSSE
jgi:hypothetical protein